MTGEALRIIGDLGKISVRPDDVVVVKVERPLTVEQVDRLHDRVAPYFPMNKVLILDAGIDLKIARRADR